MSLRFPLIAGLGATLVCLASVQMVNAQPQPLSTYSNFEVTISDKATMFDSRHNSCLRRALRTPSNVSLQVDCNRAMTNRLTKRLEKAYRAKMLEVMRRVGTEASPELVEVIAEQTFWNREYVSQCEKKWGQEVNVTSNSYSLAVSQCVAEEVYRRALWLERSRP